MSDSLYSGNLRPPSSPKNAAARNLQDLLDSNLAAKQMRMGIAPDVRNTTPGLSTWDGALRALRRDATKIGGDIKTGFDNLGTGMRLPWGSPPEAYNAVTNAAMATMGLGYGPAVGKMAMGARPSPSTLNIFAGPMSRKANTDALKKAEDMTKSGKSRDQIWQETGWFKDKDGWKYEIDDSKSQFFNQSGARDVGESLTHGKLYSNYPDVSGIPVRTSSDPNVGASYAYKAPGRSEKISLNTNREAGNIKSSLLHEVQHSIQDRENFAKGGSLQSAPSVKVLANKQTMNELGGRRVLNKFDEAHKEVMELHSVERINNFRSIKKPRNLLNTMDWYKYSDQVRRELGPMPKRSGESKQKWIADAGNFIADKLQFEHFTNFPVGDKFAKYRYGYKFDSDKKALKNHLNRAEYALNKFDRPQIQKIRKAEEGIKSAQSSNKDLSREEKYEIYRRLAGESEARNVQTRMDYTPEQRKATPPWKTLDVPEDELIFSKYY